MKLLPDTLAILKNFSGIYKSVYIKHGSNVATISEEKNIIGWTEVKDKFPVSFAVLDLNAFLATVGMFKDPSFTFHEKWVEIKDDGYPKSRVLYSYTDPDMILYPTDDILDKLDSFKKGEITFLVSEDELSNLLKAASVLGVPDLVVESNGETINLVATNVADVSSHRYTISLGEGNGNKFRMVLKVGNVKIMKGSYEVTISSRGISYFKNTSLDLDFFISLESTSQYGE